MTIVEFVVFGLATWRIASLLVDEPGPFKIFIRIRELTGIKHDADGNPLLIPNGFFSEVLSCVFCASIWIGLFWTLAQFVPFAFYFALPFALSALAIKLHPS